MAPAYPFALEVDDPAPQSRLTVFFRILMVIPHAIVISLLFLVVEVITLVAWLVILITGKYPDGMMGFVLNTLHWVARYTGYAWLLTGKYPPFALGPDDSYPVRLSGSGQVDGRNRVTVFFRMLMIIPHIIVFYFLNLALSVVLLISWFAALFTGMVPAGLHTFLAGGLRWQTRIGAYMLLLTDQYPPFSLN
ncbi:MAG: DUF4389 domain-containing protein [Acidobacteriota bacterium]